VSRFVYGLNPVLEALKAHPQDVVRVLLERGRDGRRSHGGDRVAEAAAAHRVPVLEIRAVSNPVGPRDRAAWRIGDALATLTEAFGKLAPVLESWNQHDDQ